MGEVIDLTTIEIIAQIVSIFGMTMNILSFQQKSAKGIIGFQFFGATLFGISFYLLGSFAGALLNVAGIIRAIVFINKERLHADKLPWLIFFVGLYITSYVLSFTVFGTEAILKNFIVEMLPVIGLTVVTVSYGMRNVKYIRFINLINSPLWLTYNIFAASIGGILCEILAIMSTIIAIVRFDVKKVSDKESARTL